MTLDAGVAGGVELGEVSLGALIGLQASIFSLEKEVKRLRKTEELYEFGATEHPIRKVATSPASGSLFIGLGGPAYGRKWELRRLTVGGVLWTTTVAGTALCCVGPDVAQTTPALSDIFDEAGNLPNNAFYSTQQVVVRHPSHIFVVILTPTASTQYAVGGQYTDYPDVRERIFTEE